MTVIAPTPIDAAPQVPDSSADEPDFDSEFEASLTWQKDKLTPGINALANNVYNNAVAAASSASEALTSAENAATSASIANTAKLASQTAKVAAELAETEAASLTLLYLGASATDPTTSKNSAALVAGNWYINSLTGFVKAYSGSAWAQGISAIAGVSSINNEQGALTLKTINNESLLGSGNIISGFNYINSSGVVTAKKNSVDTSLSPINLTLPATPDVGSVFEFTDIKGTFISNPLTLAASGKNFVDIFGQFWGDTLIVDLSSLEITLFFTGTDWIFQ